METEPEQTNNIPVESEPTKKNRTPLYVALGVLLVIVLASAAFLAGKMMNQQGMNPSGPQMAVGLGGPGLSIAGSGASGNGEVDMMSMVIELVPAPELPQTQPEVNGFFTKRDDNSIYIGTFNEGMGIIASSGSSSTSNGGSTGDMPTTLAKPVSSGPEVEVVITGDTKIYHETTELDPLNQPEGEIVQTVEEGSLDELGSDSMVIVWGTRTGDRVVADVILYTQPTVIMMPAP